MSERSEYAMLGTWHACWARILTVVGYSWRNRENMNLWLWESLEDLQVKKHWKRLITQSYMLQVMKSCNRYQHMYYAALAFSIDPQIDRKDNDTFFQFCPRGVQFKVSTYYSDDVRFWLPRSPKAPRIQTSWLLGIGENQQNVQTQTVRSNDFPWLQRFNNCGSCPEKIFNSHKRMERIRNRCVEHLRSYTMSQSLRTTLYHFIFNTCRFPDGTWEHLAGQDVTAGHWLRKWLHNLSGPYFHLPPTTNSWNFFIPVSPCHSRHLRSRGTCATAGGSCTWRAWGTWSAWRARSAWGGGRCRCLNGGNRFCCVHDSWTKQ